MDEKNVLLQSGMKNINSSYTNNFDSDLAKKIMDETYVILKYYIDDLDTNSKTINTHLLKNILPSLACYKAMQKNGIEQNKTFMIISKEMENATLSKVEKLKKLKNIPFFIFRIAMKVNIKTTYPKPQWEHKWLKTPKNEVAFNMLDNCLYRDTLEKYGAKELCKVFCDLDYYKLSGLQPKIKFIRTTTLVDGEFCDFRFVKEK